MKNLKALRKKHNLSQQQLADIVNRSQQSIQKYENGTAIPDLTILTALADYFNTSIDYLVGNSTIAHKIEPVSETALNEKEMETINNYRQLSPEDKSIIETLICKLASKK